MTTPQRKRASAAGAGPSQLAGNSKEQFPQYTKSEAPASVTPYQAKRLSRQRLALIRISELIRLAKFYRQFGIRVDADLFLFALAVALACVRPGTVILKGRAIPQHGLDILTLRDAAQRANLGDFTDDELWTKIEAVTRHHAKKGTNDLSAKSLGEQLQLTSAERSDCKIPTIDALDEPKAERRARKTAEKKVRDQTYNRTQRGRRPQAFRDAEAETRRRLCQEYGITERTLRRWERSGKVDVRLATSNHMSLKGRASPTGHGAEQDANGSLADPSSTDRSNRTVGKGATGGTEDHAPKSEMKRSVIASYSSDLISARSRGLDVSLMSPEQGAIPSRGSDESRMFQKKAPTMRFDPSTAIAILVEAESLLSERTETRKLAATIGLFRLQLEIETESQPEDGADTLRIGIGHLAPRLQDAAANDNRLAGIIRRLAA